MYSIVFPNFITVYPGPGIPLLNTQGYTIISTPAYSYQWYNGGVAIPGETIQCFVPTQDGIYYVMIIDSLGCTGVSKSATITDVVSLFTLLKWLAVQLTVRWYRG